MAKVVRPLVMDLKDVHLKDATVTESRVGTWTKQEVKCLRKQAWKLYIKHMNTNCSNTKSEGSKSMKTTRQVIKSDKKLERTGPSNKSTSDNMGNEGGNMGRMTPESFPKGSAFISCFSTPANHLRWWE